MNRDLKRASSFPGSPVFPGECQAHFHVPNSVPLRLMWKPVDDHEELGELWQLCMYRILSQQRWASFLTLVAYRMLQFAS